jgi:VIT1/CCC1 family predicted Fe2+/Mn2+ transporter
MKSSIVDYARQKISHTADRLTERLLEKVDRIEMKIENFQRMLMLQMIFIVLAATSGIMFLLVVFYLLTEYAGLTNTLAFLILGIVFLTAAVVVRIIMKGGDEDGEYRRKDEGYGRRYI